jgi:SagB-type dehydrogenase family enzyme
MPARILLQVCAGQETGIDMNILTAGVRTALCRLDGDGMTEEELTALTLETDGPNGLPMLYYALGHIGARGLLTYVAAGSNGTLASASGAKSFQRGQYPTGATRYVFSRFALVRRVGEHAVIETAKSSVQITIHDRDVMPLLAILATPWRIADLLPRCSGLSDDELSVLFSLLLGCGILISVDDEGHTAEDDGAQVYWDFHDLLFHGRSRFGRHLGSYGGTYPFRGRFEPLPAIKAAMSEDVIDLDRPDLQRLRREDVPFTAILEDRHTTRLFGDPPLHRRQLGEFLYRVARQRTTYEGETGMQRGSRPYPGGGAVYELEIYLSVDACVELPAGLYHYRPGEHQLSRLPARPELVTALLRKAVQVPEMVPQVLLTIAARFPRVFWKYESMAYALVLKDVGVLYQTMYLVAEAMGLGACALGGGDSDLFAAAAGLDYYEETSVGELVIGSRAEGDQ